MSYHPDSFVTSPTSATDDPAWQLHSSTDSYLNWNADPKSPLNKPHDASLGSAAPTAPPMARLRSSSSTATPSVASSRTPNEPLSADAASLLSNHGHTISPERPESPSYFTRLYFQAPNRSSSGTSPTITFTGAPAEPSLVAASQLPAVGVDASQSVTHLSDPARQLPPVRRSSVGAASPSPTATSSSPMSPTISSKSGVGGGGFFASLRPSSPANLAGSSARVTEGEPYVKPRRPSSVFEHVGNVWERFGRKVHHTRSSTSEQQSISSAHARRTASQASPPIGLTPEASDPFDAAHTSPSGSIASQASPSQSTATESECRTPATPSGETPAALAAISTPQPLPSAPAYSQLSSIDRTTDARHQDEIEELAYLAPEPSETYAPVSVNNDSPRVASAQKSQVSHRRHSSLFERVLIQVTDDNERFAVVDISGVDSADAIKERLFAKLHLFDADHSSFQLFRTEIGQSEATGPVVNDDALLVLCLQMGDDRGTLKFLVQQTGVPNATVRAMPPPTSTAGQQRALNAVRRTSGTGSAASNHLRTESQSSRSSVSDALMYPEMAGDGAHEGSNRNSGSSLTRSKAQARRALPSAPPMDDLRSPGHGQYHDRRSIASSGEGSAQDPLSKHASSVSEGNATSVMLSQRSSSMSANQPTAPGSANNARRPSYVEDERPRFDADMNANRSLHAPANGSGHRQERSDEGVRQHMGAQAPGLTLHNARSMDDLHRTAPSSAQAAAMTSPAEVRLQAGLDRDGRYPVPSILRPSTAAPAGPGGREGGHGHRQYSSDAQGAPKAPMDPATLDPRMLQRNRSAQAAIPSSQQLVSHGPTRMQSTPQIRTPSSQPSYPAHGQVDPRFSRPTGTEDPRFGGMPVHSAQSLQPRPTSPAARPSFNAPATYGPGSYPVQSFGAAQRPPMGPGYVNEFGARAPAATPNFNTYHGHDPRLGTNGMQGSLTPRPFTYHEPTSTHHHPAYRPYNPQMAGSPYRTREDPFTTRYFPASSSRQVSEFQMQAGRLEPGMTVQQTLRTQEVLRNHAVSGPPGQPYHQAHAHPPGPSYGPRDPRQPAQNNKYMGMQPYPNASAPPPPPPLPQRSAHQTQPHPNLHHQPSPRPQQFAPQAPQHGAPQHSHQPVRMHDMPASTPPAHSSSQPRPHSSASSGGRGATPQPSTASLASTSVAESHRRDPMVRVNPSERSSGSSFSSHGSSQIGRPSQEERSRNSTEDSYSAPTSARSSQSGSASAKAAGENRSSYAEQDRELADDELARVRPLPKLPASSAGTPTEATASSAIAAAEVRKSEDEDTLRAGEWAQLWRALEPSADGTVIGTAVSGSSGGDGDTVRAEPSTPGSTRPQTKDGLGSATVGLEPPRAPSPSLAPEENSTVMSFGTFDDDESESGTWAQPLDSDVNAPRLPLRLDGDEDKTSDDHSTLLPGQGVLLQSPAHAGGSGTSSSPKRPELRLTIDPAAGPTLVPAKQAAVGLSPVPSSSHLSSLSSGGITRSNSFARRDDDWAFRPPPEQLYENLDDFFPKHDLDKPLLDTAAVPESPQVSSPRSEAAASPPPPQQSVRSRLKRSIRLVAQDRKRFLDRAGKRATAPDAETSSGLVRRRSTKLWGTRVVEMTPGQELTTPASATSAESPSSEAAQKPVFKWVKGDLIGKGTYGRVYLALNATTGEMIAVKQVELPRTASDREDSRQKGVVAALKSEIETLKDLDHPHIVSYLGFEETTTFLSIFLEYVPGGSVGSCLRKHGKFEEPTIKSFLHQILDGLAYLHSKGILHRDLKADNILVDFEGICKISDFGTVRRSDDIYGNVENMSLQGSIFWMAPEVVSLSKKGYSAKIDIWSLGCVVLEMFAGRRPWSDDEAVQAMFKIGAERKAPPIPADVKLSKQAAHFLKNCFEIDPAKRPTAQRLLDHVFSVPDESWHFQQSALWRSLQR